MTSEGEWKGNKRSGLLLSMKKEQSAFCLRDRLLPPSIIPSVAAVDYSAGWIASVGQASAQVPQSAHISGLMLYLSPSEIAPTGHSSIHVPHAIQSSLIT